MRIAILVRSYPPVLNSAARLYSQLAESLAEMGHEVTVVTGYPAEGDTVAEAPEFACIKPSGRAGRASVLRVPQLSLLTELPGGKPARFLLSCLMFALRGALAPSPDVILVYSPPIYMGISAWLISMLGRSAFVFNLQDIHPKVLLDTGAVKSPFFMKMLSKMEEISYRHARSFIVFSPGNRDYLRQKGVLADIHIIPNWVDTHITYSPDGLSDFRNEYGLNGKLVVSYAGSMEDAQGLDVVVHAAGILNGRESITFVMAGEGRSKSRLHRMAEIKGIDNMLMLPVLPGQRYLQLINSSDVCLVVLSPDVPQHTVPGKLAEIMACAKPVIAVVKASGDAASIVGQARCGICVEPADADGLAKAVLTLYMDDNLRKELGDNGRRFAEQHFSRGTCTRRYEEVLRACSRVALDEHGLLMRSQRT